MLNYKFSGLDRLLVPLRNSHWLLLLRTVTQWFCTHTILLTRSRSRFHLPFAMESKSWMETQFLNVANSSSSKGETKRMNFFPSAICFVSRCSIKRAVGGWIWILHWSSRSPKKSFKCRTPSAVNVQFKKEPISKKHLKYPTSDMYKCLVLAPNLQPGCWTMSPTPIV